MSLSRKQNAFFVVLACVAGLGVCLYAMREYRIQQLLPPMEKEFAAIESKRKQHEDALLPVGATAPDFVLETSTGSSLALKQLRHGNKAILLHFWFYGCGPCQQEVPLLVNLYSDYHDAGLEVVAVNSRDSKSLLHKWALDNHIRFPVVAASNNTVQNYRVSAFPTDYLLDSEGTVLWRGVGVTDETTLRSALRQAGIVQARPVLTSKR